ncbi:MAG: GGDEF domain-containing protein [Brevinema sp.]
MKILLISENPATIDLVEQTGKKYGFNFKAVSYADISKYYDQSIESVSLQKHIFKTNYDVILVDTIALDYVKEKYIIFNEDDLSLSPVILLVDDFKTLDLLAVQTLRIFYTLNLQCLSEEELYANFTLLREKLSINKKASSWALMDSLTNVFNRRTFYNHLENLVSEYQNQPSESICLSFLDIDYFKFINDTFGHNAGDEVLKVFAKILSAKTRDSDIVARVGGEEFAIIFPNTSLEAANKILERIREVMVQTTDLEEHLKVTFSAGLIEIKGGTTLTIDELVGEADMLLYKAKDMGRDRICF